MTDIRHQVLHGLAILKAAPAAELARRTGLPAETVEAELAAAEASGRTVRAGERWTLSPLARLALQADYSRLFADVRADAAVAEANAAFETLNVALKQLMTDWQLITVAGQKIANDHSDAAHDARIIDRLGALHERAEPVLARLEAGMPAVGFYRRALLEALERAEDGDVAWVSDAGLESYHTLWFELHEELIRALGGRRTD
jgi:hypothetical protein